jgi:uncharacterized protein YndB with AHSA1/START domain
MDGTLTTTERGHVLRFERTLNKPIDSVWAALTQPTLMKDWLANDAEIDLRVGGAVRMNDHEIDSTIVELDEPRVIAYGWKGPKWDGGIVRWQLEAAGEDTRLVLTHEMPAMSDEEAAKFKNEHPDLPEGWAPVPSTLAGWHSILDRLVAAMKDAPIADSMEHWRELHEHYTEKVAK